MLPVHLLRSVPLASEERMTTADDLALKERGEGGIVLVGHGRRAEEKVVKGG